MKRRSAGKRCSGEEGVLQHTLPRPVTPYYSDMSLEMRDQFNASLLGNVSPEDAARTMKENLENLIQQGQDS